jgi:alkylation response protein AidB-like acyl-CoA dehydrogenase
MGDLGLLGMTVPPEYGGAGADTLTWAVVQEELARASAAVADSQLLVKLMTDMLLHNGTEAQRRAYLPALVRGEKICVIAQTEPGTGSDVAGVQTSARPAGDGWVLNGTKRFITAAHVCDVAVVVATTDRQRGREGIALFLVEFGTPGFSRGAREHLMGVRGLATGELIFEECRVPACACSPRPETASSGRWPHSTRVGSEWARRPSGSPRRPWGRRSATPGNGAPSASRSPRSRQSSS